jgi:outer membrane immunogenic protein
MKRILLGCAAVVVVAGISGAAAAADLPRRMPMKAPVYAPMLFSWTGLYLGINAGGDFGKSRWNNTAAPALPNSFNVSGAMVGGTIGYNWQFNQWVAGLEGDIDWAGNSGTNKTGTAAQMEKTQNHWLSTVRGRIGYAGFDRFLPYVTGGAAFGDIKASLPGFNGASATRAGFAVGGGLEYAFMGPLSVKVEYLYIDLGSFNCGTGCGAPVGRDNVNFHTNVVRAGLNYRF